MKMLRVKECCYGVLVLYDPETGEEYGLEEKELGVKAPELLEAHSGVTAKKEDSQ